MGSLFFFFLTQWRSQTFNFHFFVVQSFLTTRVKTQTLSSPSETRTWALWHARRIRFLSSPSVFSNSISDQLTSINLKQSEQEKIRRSSVSANMIYFHYLRVEVRRSWFPFRVNLDVIWFCLFAWITPVNRWNPDLFPGLMCRSCRLSQM